MRRWPGPRQAADDWRRMNRPLPEVAGPAAKNDPGHVTDPPRPAQVLAVGQIAAIQDPHRRAVEPGRDLHVVDIEREFAAIFEVEVDYVAASLRRLGVRPADLDDQVQEVFIAVHRHLADCDRTRPLRPWLFAFAYRAAANYRRLARHRRELVIDGPSLDSVRPPDGAPSPERHSIDRQRRERLIDALDGLDLEHRAAVVLCDVEGLTAVEAATVLEVPLNTVYSRVRNGRKKLHARLTLDAEEGGSDHG